MYNFDLKMYLKFFIIMVILVYFKFMINRLRSEDFKWYVVYDNKSWYKLLKLREVLDSLSGE